MAETKRLFHEVVKHLPPDATTCGATTYLNKEDLTPATLRALR